MARILLIGRLAARDVRRRPTEAVLLLIALVAATTTLTLGLVLNGATSQPFQHTRVATAGPDVVAIAAPASNGGPHADPATLTALAHASDVTGRSGPYPVIWSALSAHGHTVAVTVEGRDPTPTTVDQPKVTRGTWVSNGGVVVERSFADALGVHTGEPVILGGRSFRITGIAVTAALPPYPNGCFTGCVSLPGHPTLDPTNPGLVWVTQPDARDLPASAQTLGYVVNLKLANPAGAAAFIDAHSSNASDAPVLNSWQDISWVAANLVRNEQPVMLVGSWLLGLLAVASIAVLVGGRMADQIRRVGLLKAVGATPGLVAAVLLAEYLLLALVAAAAGLGIGWLSAPLLAAGGGLLASSRPPRLTLSTVGIVVVVAVGVAVAATLVPAIRAARSSTVRALADAARLPRRYSWLITVSARLPVPLLLGLRLVARRPRRTVLSMISLAITVSGIVAVLVVHTHNSHHGGSSGLNNPRTDAVNEVLAVITVLLATLAAVNTVFTTWAMSADARHACALTRSLGATPAQVTTGLAAAQVLPALVGATIGVPAGIGLVLATSTKHDATVTMPPSWSLIATVVLSTLVVAGLSALPARIAARRPPAEILQAELV